MGSIRQHLKAGRQAPHCQAYQPPESWPAVLVFEIAPNLCFGGWASASCSLPNNSAATQPWWPTALPLCLPVACADDQNAGLVRRLITLVAPVSAQVHLFFLLTSAPLVQLTKMLELLAV